ncbi:rhomboid family intramembrane serine protease [Halioxenophilus aromaticivorans]|uniref:Peptidase S54 rhomboid domain-containing protein n=1 Tax=Halioxenophilus aromaticivorans TaxID=1306992 RepID=A0AAV3U466_9ALTE
MPPLVSKLPWLSTAVILLCLVNYLFIPFNSEAFLSLALDQSRPWNAVAWMSAHLTHSDGNHLLWNLAAMAVLGFIIESQQRLLLALGFAASVVAIDVWFFNQAQFQVYVGLSGVLNGLLVVALYSLRSPQVSSVGIWRGNEMLWLVLVLAVAKSVYELYAGDALFSNTRWQSTPSFHLVGLAAGAVVVSVWHRFKTWRHAATP